MRAVEQSVDVTVGGEMISGRPRNGSRLPAEWEMCAPNPVLSPRFGSESDAEGRTRLWAEGNGREECFGYLRRSVRLEAGKTYRLRVCLEASGLTDLNRHLKHGVFSKSRNTFNEGILRYTRGVGGITGEQRFRGPAEATEAEVRLHFRFSPHGRVRWNSVILEECEPIPERPVRIACSWGEGDMRHWSRWLDAAGQRGVDVALLPESFAGTDPTKSQPIDGPAPTLLAEKAGQWRMHVSGAFYEQRGDIVLNTAPLYDRSGSLLGSYSKNQLFDPELDQGVTPGKGYPVFKTDFAVVGIIICYDSWFPETVRLLAYKGAELVLLPNAGYYTSLMAARAADNGVWLAASTLGSPAGVWDPSGSQAGEAAPEPTRFAPSSIRSFERDEQLRILVATVDLSRRYSPHWWGGPMLSAPGGRRVRQTLIQPIEAEIAAEAGRWVDDQEVHFDSRTPP